MLRLWLSLGLFLAIGTACVGGPQPDPPGGDLRDAAAGADGGAAGVDSGAVPRDADARADGGPAFDGGAVDSGPPAMDGAVDGGDAGDAGEDAGMPDAGVTCEDYCECMFGDPAHCLSGDGRTRMLCVMNCGSLTYDQLRCRTMHCGYADGPTSGHCMHALGIGMCE